MIYTIFLILGGLAALGSIGLICLFLYVYIQNKSEIPLATNNKVVVIVPCKGIIKNLKDNLMGICEQDYPNYKVVFVLDSKEDPAFKIISRIVKDNKNGSVEFAEKINEASGKISALISGIKKTDGADIYVFADSDILPHKLWLINLVSNLKDDNVGATTGFRWFFPSNLKSYLISSWNMASMISILHPRSSFAWGGSTAITKKIFDKLKIESRWRKGFSDDLILTEAVRKAGYKIKFVPACIVESPEETNIKKFLFWGTQQFIWVKWYYPSIYYFGFFAAFLLQIFIFLGLILLLTGFTLPGILMISTFFSEMIYGLTGILVFKSLMNYPKEKFGKTLPYAILMPFVYVLFTYNLLLSGVKQEIKWGGRYYRKKDALGKMKF